MEMRSVWWWLASTGRAGELDVEAQVGVQHETTLVLPSPRTATRSSPCERTANTSVFDELLSSRIIILILRLHHTSATTHHAPY
jgi:hypothetical protein